jgi:transposase
MPATYSEDLRQKAITAVQRGERKINASRMLQISCNTLDLWLKRVDDSASCPTHPPSQKGQPRKITDWERFQAFVAEHGGKTQAQMAALWGEGITQQNISDALRKLRVSRKKNLQLPRTR